MHHDIYSMTRSLRHISRYNDDNIPTGKRPLGRPRRRWEDNIRMDLEEIGISAGNWVVRLRIGIIGEPL